MKTFFTLMLFIIILLLGTIIISELNLAEIEFGKILVMEKNTVIGLFTFMALSPYVLFLSQKGRDSIERGDLIVIMNLIGTWMLFGVLSVLLWISGELSEIFISLEGRSALFISFASLIFFVAITIATLLLYLLFMTLAAAILKDDFLYGLKRRENASELVGSFLIISSYIIYLLFYIRYSIHELMIPAVGIASYILFMLTVYPFIKKYKKIKDPN